MNTILPAKLAAKEVYCHFLLNRTFTKQRAISAVPNPEAYKTKFVATYVICALLKDNFDIQDRPTDVGITYEAEVQARNLTNLVKIR